MPPIQLPVIYILQVLLIPKFKNANRMLITIFHGLLNGKFQLIFATCILRYLKNDMPKSYKFCLH